MLIHITRTKNSFPAALQRRQKEPSPPPTRQSQFNYAMMKEGALRKKLQELGIPNWGSKDLMKRRHIEWLNIHNSNCDADDSVRKTKRQLVKELEEWENTQGGRADIKESKIMRKDFDGNGYAKSHKNDFDDLIAQARKKRSAPKSNDKDATNGQKNDATQHDPQSNTESSVDMPDASICTETRPQQPIQENRVEPQGPDTNHGIRLGTHLDGTQPTNEAISNSELESRESVTTLYQKQRLGTQNPLRSPSPKLPIFAMSDEPAKEVGMPTT